MFKLTATVKTIHDEVQVTDKFKKREFVVEDSSSMYPQTLLFQTVQDKCSMLDGIAEGEQVEVSFNLNGREWVNPEGITKVFNSLDCWRIEAVNQGVPQGTLTASTPKTPTPTGNDDGDLPF